MRKKKVERLKDDLAVARHERHEALVAQHYLKRQNVALEERLNVAALKEHDLERWVEVVKAKWVLLLGSNNIELEVETLGKCRQIPTWWIEAFTERLADNDPYHIDHRD